MMPWDVIRKIGVDFLFPFGSERVGKPFRLHREWLIALVGIVPLAALCLDVMFLIYIMLALYVSILWGMFFWSHFKTDSSSIRTGVICFCVTAFLSTTLLMIFNLLDLLQWFDALSKSESALLRFIGFLAALVCLKNYARRQLYFGLCGDPAWCLILRMLYCMGFSLDLALAFMRGCFINLA